MISGYIISVVLRRETNRTFILRRVFRIFPMLALMIVVVILTNPPQIQGMSLGHVIQVGLENLTLLNYLRSPQVVLIGVAWTLAIELVFYLVALILKPLLTRTPVKLMFPAALIAVSAVMIATSRVFGGGPYFQLSVFFIYIPIFAIGSIFALRDSNEIRAMWGWLLGALAFGVFLYGTRNFYPQFLVPTDSYPISAIYVVVIFGVAWVFRESIPRIRVMSAIALISYSLYLVHGVIGQPVLRWLVEYQNWSYTAAFFLAVAITFALSTATYLVIEQPANTLARRLTSRRPGQTE
jgi:peptidoglycan/LPS O-acetylase OafA/YrhL